MRGADILPLLADLATLRIEVFRDWPYLYDGDPNYERDYITTYARSPRAAIVIARDGHDIVGASTCLPLSDEDVAMQAPFRRAGLDVARICYFGESVLRAAYRGQGIGVAFFAAREAHARSLAGIDTAAFCAVIREADDPRRPNDAGTLEHFWHHRGFAPRQGLICTMAWREIGKSDEVKNRLQVWLKPL